MLPSSNQFYVVIRIVDQRITHAQQQKRNQFQRFSHTTEKSPKKSLAVEDAEHKIPHHKNFSMR